MKCSDSQCYLTLKKGHQKKKVYYEVISKIIFSMVYFVELI